MAVGNVRALTFKKNAAELEEKLSDIKRLVGALKKFVHEAFSAMYPTSNTVESRTRIAGVLEARFVYDYVTCDARCELWNGSVMLKAERDFDLETAQLVHENLDVLIALAETLCTTAGCFHLFRAKMARFAV